MKQAQIQEALDATVQGVANIPAFTGENITHKADGKQPFTRTTLLPARPNQLTMGANGRDELIGLYQIDLYYPLGSGTLAARNAADLVAAAFPRTWMVEVDGYQLRAVQSWVEAGREVNNWYAVSALVSWSVVR